MTKLEKCLESNPKILKWERLKKILSCTFCPPNKIENSKKHNQYNNKHWSWKFRNKNKKQFE